MKLREWKKYLHVCKQLSCVKDNFVWYKILESQLFSITTLKMFVYCLLAFAVRQEKFDTGLIFLPLLVTSFPCLFFLIEDFLLILQLVSFILLGFFKPLFNYIFDCSIPMIKFVHLQGHWQFLCCSLLSVFSIYYLPFEILSAFIFSVILDILLCSVSCSNG